jgi:hypothetical protein
MDGASCPPCRITFPTHDATEPDPRDLPLGGARHPVKGCAMLVQLIKHREQRECIVTRRTEPSKTSSKKIDFFFFDSHFKNFIKYNQSST